MSTDTPPLWATRPAATTWEPQYLAPTPAPSKVLHTKGWAIAWAIASAVFFLSATFWLLAFVVVQTTPRCAYDTVSGSTYNVCVTPNTGNVSITDVSGS